MRETEMAKTAKHTETRRVVVDRDNVRIERISDRCYAEYVVYVAGKYYGSHSTLLEAETAGNAAAYELAKEAGNVK
jgi:hypothetical protein